MSPILSPAPVAELLSSVGVLAGVAGLVGFVALMVSYATVFAKLRIKIRAADASPPVSILKPLKGLDEGLYENLSAIAAQDYPEFEILFCAEDPQDPALDVARQVQAEFPHREIRVLSGAAADGLNPKVRILRRLLPVATHEWLLVSDSNVRPEPDYLTVLLGYQKQAGADLVSTLLRGVGSRSLGALLENLQLNSWVAASVCMPERFGHPCVIGKTMLTRRSTLDAVGGFDELRDILAEDYTLGARLTAAGYKVSLSPYRLQVVNGARDVRSFFNRHVRWGQLRRRIAPGVFLFEFVVQPTPWLLLGALLGGGHWPLLAGGALLVKFFVEAYLYWKIDERVPVTSLMWMPLKDLLVFAMWFPAAMRSTVAWRGHRMRIGPESRLTSLDQESQTVERPA